MKITLPFDTDLEALALSCAINSQMAAAHVFSETHESDYQHPPHSLLYNICKKIFLEGKNVDLHIILHCLKTENKTNILSSDELLNISQYVPIPTNWEEYCDKLKNLTSLRRIIYSSKDAIALANKADARGDEVISILQNKLLDVQGTQKNSFSKIGQVIENFSRDLNFSDHLDWMIEQRKMGKAPYEGIPCGYKILDETLGFFRNSCIYYIGARTSMGKTTFALNLMHNMNVKSIGFFSLEMPADIITSKILCVAADVKYSHYEDGALYPEKVERLREVAHQFKDKEIYIEDPSSITITNLRSLAKRLKTNYKIEILFIDYLTRIKGSGTHNSKHLEVDEVSKGLQSLAKELKIPIICLSQLNRQSGKDSASHGKGPSLMDFRESGSIEEDADACILLHRPDYYDPMNKPGTIEVKIAKNRLRGILKTVEFSCNFKESDRYYECPPIEEVRRMASNEEANDVLNSITGRSF
jgi:replicative DNA helicase